MSHPCIDCGKEVKTNGYLRCKSCGVKNGKPRKPIEQRFWVFVNKDGPTMPHMDSPCWEWMGHRFPDGYGVIAEGGRGGKTLKAHRVSWIIHNGPIPDNQQVLHHCDNPPCPNPTHLFLGTNLDNVRDKISKGRTPNFKGELNPAAKITKVQAIEIKTRYNQGGISQRALAKEYNMTQANVWYIVNGEHWL